MSRKTIEIIVSPRGETMLTTKGFAGTSCRDISRSLEEALGQRTSEQFTAEYHASDFVQQTGRVEA